MSRVRGKRAPARRTGESNPEAPPAEPPRGPLAATRVLDFTVNLPGPYATFVLRSLGAEVIKIESPAGDPARGMGRLFDLLNRGKQSVVLDLKEAVQREALARLIPTADVLVEGFRPGVMERLGCGPERARELNPRLIYCSISGYGQHGSYAPHPCHDLNFQALTGTCHLARDAAGRPVATALPVADFSSAMAAVAAILAALFAREREGTGRTLDIAMTDALLSWVYVWDRGVRPTEAPPEAALALLRRQVAAAATALPGPLAGLGAVAERVLGSATAARFAQGVGGASRWLGLADRLDRLKLYALPHYGLYRTRDGRYVSVGIVDEERFWRSLCRQVGLSALSDLPLPLRFVAGEPLRVLFARRFRRRTLAEWLATLDLAEVPVAAVLSLDEAMADPQLGSRRTADGLPLPLTLGEPPAEPAPALGEHTEALLGAVRAFRSRQRAVDTRWPGNDP